MFRAVKVVVFLVLVCKFVCGAPRGSFEGFVSDRIHVEAPFPKEDEDPASRVNPGGKQLFADDDRGIPVVSEVLSLPSPYDIFRAPDEDLRDDPSTLEFDEPPTVLDSKSLQLEGYTPPSPNLIQNPAQGLSRLYEAPGELSADSAKEPTATQLILETTQVTEAANSTPQGTTSKMKGMLMPFQFEWRVSDPVDEGLNFSHMSSSDGVITKGEYRVLLPDGRTQVVTYTDDGTGFFPEISYV